MVVNQVPAHRRLSRFMQRGIALAMLLALVAMSLARAAIPASGSGPSATSGKHASPPDITNPQDWVEQKVFDSQGGYYDHFGTAVAISGTTAFIAAPEVTLNGNSSQGTVYVFNQAADGSWSQAQKLVASDGAAYNEFGWSVALSGRTAIVSAINAKIGSNNSQGAAYVFTQGDDGTWSETQKLVASDGQPVDWFGSAVAMSDSTIVVAAYGAHYNDQAMRGAVYVFNNVGGTWTQTQELAASDGTGGDEFGLGIALSGSSILASAPGANINGNYAQGAVYAFAESGGVWSETQKFVAADGVASDQLGSSLALDGATALVGAVWHHGGQGAVYVLTDSSGSWSQTQQLKASNGATRGVSGFGLPPTDNFGLSVALHGTTALIGADNIPVNGNDGQGVVYQFTNSGGTWSGTHAFIASDGVALDYLGISVAYDGANVLAGAFGYTPDGNHYQQGAAYFFAGNGIPASERAALIDLYNSTNGAGWWDTVGWLGAPGTECTWTGVTCDDTGTTVVGLAFDLTNMTGSLPDTLNGLTNLTNLQISDQSGLVGSIPSLTGLTHLQSIDLSSNAFTGNLPSLAGLTSLQVAIFRNNQLTGPIPSFAGLAGLQWFQVSANQLSGSIPSLDGLSNLSGFYVDYNQLTGPPPALPVPTGLGQYSAALCPNYLDHVESTDWDAITGVTPWYHDCVTSPADTVFGDGFDGT